MANKNKRAAQAVTVVFILAALSVYGLFLYRKNGLQVELYSAVWENDLRKAEAALKRGADPNGKPGFELPEHFWFSKRGGKSLGQWVAYLYDQREPLRNVFEQWRSYKYNALLIAYHQNRKSDYLKSGMVKLLKKYHAKDNLFSAAAVDLATFKKKAGRVKGLKENDGFIGTPLHVAAFFGRADICLYLITHGMDPNLKFASFIEVTPLDVSVMEGKREAATVLLQNGAALKQTSPLSTLYLAVINGWPDLIPLLVKYGADIKGEESLLAMRSSVMAYSIPKLLNPNKDNYLKLIRVLKKHGADINAFSKILSPPPIHAATLRGRPEMVRTLLEEGADPTVLDRDGKTTIAALAKGYGTGGGATEERIKTLYLLSSAGVKINTVDKEGLSPLDIALNNRQTAMAEALRAMGAKSAQAHSGKTKGVPKPEANPVRR